MRGRHCADWSRYAFEDRPPDVVAEEKAACRKAKLECRWTAPLEGGGCRVLPARLGRLCNAG